jgi:hypothetical protein
MALPTVQVPPLDPMAYTGPVRTMSGIARTGDITLDSPYGSNGAPEYGRWLYVGASGNVTYQKWDGTSQTLVNLAGGAWHPIYSTMVYSSGTSATGLVWGS